MVILAVLACAIWHTLICDIALMQTHKNKNLRILFEMLYWCMYLYIYIYVYIHDVALPSKLRSDDSVELVPHHTSPLR